MNIDTHQLTQTAFEILILDITHHGNKPGDIQRAALRELLSTMTGYACSTETGRKAFGLATGCGKTSALVAWLVALHRLGLEHVSVSVAASKVEALCSIKKKLLQYGIPEDLIGLKHSHPGASLPSTGDEDRRYQLVTHARVRGGSDHDLFIRHEGERRAVMIYDETLFRSDTFALSQLAVDVALAAFEVHAGRLGREYAGVLNYLVRCKETIKDSLETSRKELLNGGSETTVVLPLLTQIEVNGYMAQLESLYAPGVSYEALQQLLSISQTPLRLIATQNGDGLIWYKLTVPEDLKDVIVLDASYPIRRLIHLDPTIEAAGSFLEVDVKRFDNVSIYQMLSPGGRHTMEKAFSHASREKRALSKEIIEVVKANSSARGFLIFTFKKKDVDIGRLLLQDLAASGINLDERLPDGRKRFNLLTWGDEASLNGYDHCDVVIMAGVLHRNYLDIAAAIVGQQDQLDAPVDNLKTTEMLTSEICHLIYQGASRGSCRTITDGQANPMSLYLIHRGIGIRAELAKVMKGAQWQLWEPKHSAAKATGIVDRLALQIIDHLESLPGTLAKVPTRTIKAALGLSTSDGAMAKAFTRAIGAVTTLGSDWYLEGKSMVRLSTMFQQS